MNTEVFDGIVREMSEVSTRRNVFRLFGGAAALTAGLTLGGTSLARGKSRGRAKTEARGKHAATAERRGNNGQRITICYKNQTRNVKKRGYRTKFPGATVGTCPTTPTTPQPQPAACTSWILSGGPDPNTNIQVDDDLQVMVNGVAVINDGDNKASSLTPARFTAKVGDSLGITAFDANPA